MLVQMASNELLEKYHHFKQILSDNYDAMQGITELDEMLSSENSFGFKFIQEKTQEIHGYVENMVGELSYLTGEENFQYYGYNELYSRIDELNNIVEKKVNKKHHDLTNEPYVINFEQIDKEMGYLVGGKCASLGELISNTDVPVPGGFAVTTKAYRDYIAHNELQDEIENALDTLDVNDTAALNKASKHIKTMIQEAEMPQEMVDHIKEQYSLMKEKYGEQLTVAVRSSGSAEDLPDASFAGLHNSFLNITDENLIDTVKNCFASMYNARAIFYRDAKGFAHNEVALSVAVQKMVNSEVSGIMFSRDPTVKDKELVAIDAIYGLGEYIVGGKVSADHYIVDRKRDTIVEKNISQQSIQLVNCTGGTQEITLDKEKGAAQKATDEEIKQLTRFALALEQHYGTPQDIEWARDAADGHVYIVQSRPITVMDSTKQVHQLDLQGYDKILDEGITASSGAAHGQVYIVNNADDLEHFPEGAILVSKITSPDYVPALKKAAGVITDSGSFISHAAIVTREFGIPAIVGAPHATSVLENGQEITMDAGLHTAYEGEISELLALYDATPNTTLEQKKKGLFTSIGSWISNLFSKEKDISQNNHKNTDKSNKGVLSYCSPLHLTDSASPEFKPKNCISYHDIVRFVHEKSINSMFHNLHPNYNNLTQTQSYYNNVGVQMHVLDLDNALSTDESEFKAHHVESKPLKAIMDFYESLTPGQKNNTDSLNIIATSDYVNASMKMGCHSATFDTMCTDIDSNNYVSVKYLESYDSHKGSRRRKELVRRVLAEEGFTFKNYNYKTRELNAEIKGLSKEQTEYALQKSVSILGAVRDLDLDFDTLFWSSSRIDQCVDEFNKGNYKLSQFVKSKWWRI